MVIEIKDRTGVVKNEKTKRIELWIHLYRDDIWSSLKLIVPTLMCVFLVQKIPWIIRSGTLSKFDSETVGIIASIEARKGNR